MVCPFTTKEAVADLVKPAPDQDAHAYLH
jgi:hypothetical protein